VTSGRLAALFCEAWGPPARWEPAGEKETEAKGPHESGLLTLDCAKIKKVLGWTPRWDIKQSVEASVQWYRAYYSGGNANTVMANQINEFFAKGEQV
jgi:CDP-glucose 4,6-dehydratase